MPPGDAVIEVQDLVKSYGELTAVDGISFDVREGEVFALLGPNGAGKTTTTEILETIRRADAGTLRVLGLDVARESERIRARIGVMPQDFRSWDLLTCRENVAYYAAMYRSDADVDALLQLVGLEDRAGTRYEELSGGLQQRLGIAIALVNDPELVFLDEPTTGLDPGARRDVWGVVQGLADQGRTVFLTTHYMEEAHHLADRVAIMDHGRIVDLGTPGGLIRSHAPGQTVVVHDAADLVGRVDAPAEVDGADLLLHVEDGRDLGRVLQELASLPEPPSFDVRSGTLEDVFLGLTGHHLREGEPVPAEGGDAA